MKKTKLFFAVLILNSAFLILNCSAQTFPYGINYQAVARDANGNAKAIQQVPIQFTIYKTTKTGTVIWQERQLLTTNNMGQFNAIIGTGAPVTPFNATSFSQINWGADSTFLKVELNSNISFTGTFSPMGNTTKFQSVPYALCSMYSLSTNLKAPTVQKFLSGTGSYTTTAGVLYIEVEMIGGGGGGAGNGNSNGAAGGGGGGYLKFIVSSPSPAYTYSVGTGGTGGAVATTNPGTVGNNTTFGSNICGGGAGGNGGTGGSGGINTFSFGVDIVNMQGNGGWGQLLGGGGAAYQTGSSGGVGFFGGGTYTSSGTAHNGADGAANSGSGGAGGSGNNSASGGSGGNGGSGIIIVKEYYQ